MPKANQLGRHLRKTREQMKLSLREVSRRAQVGVATLSRTESGETLPTFPIALRLFAVLNLDISVLQEALGPRKTSLKRRTTRK